MPRILDCFCGAGGCSRGYMDAGFEAVGIDIEKQPRYIGHAFIQMDALDALQTLIDGGSIWDTQGGQWRLSDFSAIHASPPCQGYSIMNNLPWLEGREYPLLILPTMELLEQTGKLYTLENVMGARNGAKGLKKRGLEAHGLKAGYLCGTMFGLPFYRHRLFATNWFWLAPGHPKHRVVKRAINEKDPFHDANGKSLVGPGNLGKGAGLQGINAWCAQSGQVMGHQHAGAGWCRAAEVMEITWMTRAELSQAIPPAYTRYLGTRLLEVITEARI